MRMLATAGGSMWSLGGDVIAGFGKLERQLNDI
jgi:hypothetical protein